MHQRQNYWGRNLAKLTKEENTLFDPILLHAWKKKKMERMKNISIWL